MDFNISAVHELWAAPKENWFDYFVHVGKFKRLLNEERKSEEEQEELRKLVIQFAEQAVNVEAETETLIKKNFGAEDISFHQRKSACLWLCSLSALAAIDWHFERLIERTEDIILVNGIFDRIEAWKEHLCPPAAGAAAAAASLSFTFPAFLLARWRVFVHARFRVDPPEAKQTVSNPSNLPDQALQKFEQAKTVISKMMYDQLDLAQQLLEHMLVERKDLWVPKPQCFIQPFIEHGGLSLSIGIVGANVLVGDDNLRPRVPTGSERDTVVIPFQVLARKIHYELANSCFTGLKMIKAVGSFKQLLACSSSDCLHPLITIDERRVNGLAAAFRLPPPFPHAVPSTSREEILGEVKSTEPNPKRVSQRRYGTRRDRMEEKVRSSLAHATMTGSTNTRRSLNSLIDDLSAGEETVGWKDRTDREGEQKKSEIEERLSTVISSSGGSNRQKWRGRGVGRAVAASAPLVGVQSLLSALAPLPSTGPSIGLATRRAPMPSTPPSAASIRAMAASDKPFWTLVTSFDAAELQTAFKLEGVQYSRPAMLRFPEVLADVILAARPFDELHALLLGKLQQLTEMGDSDRWQSCLDAFVPILGVNTTQSLLEMSIYEATRVQMVCMNRQLLTPHANLRKNQMNLVLGVAHKLVKITQVQPLVGPMVAFLLNLEQFKFVMSNLDPDAGSTNQLLNAGKVLAALMDLEATGMKGAEVAVATTFHTVMAPHFEAVASKRRLDGFTTMHLKESGRLRVQFQKMFSDIKLSKLQSFIVSYFAHLYTQAIAARGRIHLRVYAQYADLFGGCSLSLAHLDAIEEMLTTLIDRGLALVPHNTHLLRTKADFAYVRNELNEAGRGYCELLVASKASLSMPLLHAAAAGVGDVVDESVWSHLRVCLRKNKQQTLAAVVCQLFNTGRAKECRKAAEAVQQRACLDASDECFGLIYDMQLVEALSDSYKKRGEQQKLEMLIDVVSSVSMNANNSPEVMEREMRRKQKRLLNTLASIFFDVQS